ncbi:MAG: M1 family metallopeptidase [Deltaproteobacteria bacterium]|nr:M1 family metallopeptidase [Deltaproteobacteria bacterium]
MIRAPGAPALRLALLVACLLAASGAGATAPTAPGLTYRIDARLDPEARTVTGHLHARWVHPGGAPVDALLLHLYLNGFDSNRTTLMTELRLDSWLERHPDGGGRIDLATLRVDGRDRLAALEYVRPDDGNPDDRTLARVPLPRPLGAREAVELDIDFVASLPRVLLRTGHAGPFFVVAQWFPKLAAFRAGAWRAHQFHAASEFFADFATWDVSLTVPAAFVVGHTGVATATHDNGDGSKTIEVHAEAVHDFAWVADPRFQVIDRTIAGVPVRLLVQPHHRLHAARYLDATRVALERYAEWIEPYPYPALTVVDPGPGARGAGGMEYPMLVTVGTSRWLPAGVRLPEVVTIHELGHQWWYGIVASDEVEEPWLDEGINRYVEGRIMDATYGPGSYVDWLGLQVDSTALARWSYLEDGRWDPVTTASFRMLDRDSYVATAYNKTALVLGTVAGLFGADPLLAALGDYARLWRFRQPTGADLRASLANSLGPAVTPVLDQLLDGTGTLDYAVARVDVRRVPTPAPRPGGEVPPPEPARFRSEIVVERRGEVRLPVEILVAYDDGSQTRETWDGQSRWYRIDAVSTRQASYAIVDPDHRLPLDADWLNNSRLRDPGTRGIWRLAARWGIWLQSALMGLSGL